jgi:hypothetical protein
MIFYRVAYADLKKKLPKLTSTDYDTHYANLKRDHGAGDPKVTFNDAKKTIEIEHFGEDLLIFNRPLANALRSAFPVGQGSTPQMIDAGFLTPEGVRRKTKILEQSRDALRDLPYQDTPAGTPAIDGTKSALDNLKDIAAGNPKGACFGGAHGDDKRNQVMMDLLADPGHGGMNLFFIEEIGVGDQALVDQFLSSPAGTPLPPDLKTRVKPITGIEEILVRMRDHNLANPGDKLKAFGINSAEAKSRDGLLGLENRVVMMNAIAKDAMDRAIRANPGQKYLAFVGAAHSNTHPGGIPGIAQIMGLPAVKVDDKGKLQMDEEDKSLRGMPSKEEIRRLEARAAQLENDPEFKKITSQDEKHALLQKMIVEERVVGFNRLDRKGRIAHLNARSALGGGVLSEEEMAEQIVLEAEATVLAAYPQKDEGAMAEVKDKKHKELVLELTAKLKALPADKKKNPRELVTKLADAVAGGSALGFFKKDKQIKKGGSHVSIDVQAARQTWIRKLATL